MVRPFTESDTEEVIDLWAECGLVRPWNDPRKDIQRKLLVQPELFLVGSLGNELIATVMAGYDGHRGWVNYLAVAPRHQGSGLGRTLMQAVESRLVELGCPKLNLQVRGSNKAAVSFYRRIGYAVDDVMSLGKRLIKD